MNYLSEKAHTHTILFFTSEYMDMLKEKVAPFISSPSGQKPPRKSESFAQDKVTHTDLQVMITTQYYSGVG